MTSSAPLSLTKGLIEPWFVVGAPWLGFPMINSIASIEILHMLPEFLNLKRSTCERSSYRYVSVFLSISFLVSSERRNLDILDSWTNPETVEDFYHSWQCSIISWSVCSWNEGSERQLGGEHHFQFVVSSRILGHSAKWHQWIYPNGSRSKCNWKRKVESLKPSNFGIRWDLSIIWFKDP